MTNKNTYYISLNEFDEDSIFRSSISFLDLEMYDNAIVEKIHRMLNILELKGRVSKYLYCPSNVISKIIRQYGGLYDGLYIDGSLKIFGNSIIRSEFLNDVKNRRVILILSENFIDNNSLFANSRKYSTLDDTSESLFSVSYIENKGI